MIYDKLQNINNYRSLHPRFEKAFEFLKATDLENLPTGKHLIDDEDIFVSVSEYSTKKVGFLEGHKDYIDIQLITKGAEKVGHAKLNDQKIKEEYDPAKDIAFYHGECKYITLIPDDFVILFPDDLHMPGIMNGKSSDVKKIVIKIKV
ncbi:MAG: YhcH/YjgK/YiaL family protein [Candidatus Delongbacteria bacterium]|jgi:YhcH/YjgK/YiaL family protein|nr:YhcH/YjgK/YiaL family protein [Candidatus Delongbacteria bacterium]